MARILLVEDDRGLAFALTRFLSAGGHDVMACHEPLGALEELESGRAVDLLVSDLRFPAGLPHGFALGRMAKLRRPALPIIFITGHPDIAERDRTPPGPVLFKPIALDALSAAVADQLAGAGRPPA